MKMTLRKKYDIACRALRRVGCEHWGRYCKSVLRRLGELGRLNRERREATCRRIRRNRMCMEVCHKNTTCKMARGPK